MEWCWLHKSELCDYKKDNVTWEWVQQRVGVTAQNATVSSNSVHLQCLSSREWGCLCSLCKTTCSLSCRVGSTNSSRKDTSVSVCSCLESEKAVQGQVGGRRWRIVVYQSSGGCSSHQWEPWPDQARISSASVAHMRWWVQKIDYMYITLVMLTSRRNKNYSFSYTSASSYNNCEADRHDQPHPYTYCIVMSWGHVRFV